MLDEVDTKFWTIIWFNFVKDRYDTPLEMYLHAAAGAFLIVESQEEDNS